MLRREKVKRHALLLSFLMIILFLFGCAVKYETATNSAGVSATTYEGRVLTDVGIWSQLVTMYDSFTRTLFQNPPPTVTPPAATEEDFETPAQDPPAVEPAPSVQPAEEPQVEPPAHKSYTLTGKEVEILWVPDSESDHKLVVIPHKSYGNVSVSLNGEKGKFSGRANGNRPHYRFSKPGKYYPDPSFLQVDGREFVVTSPAERHEKLKEIK
jgi:hypothetical protein